MSVLVLLLGAATIVAGLGLAGSGFSIHDRTFDTDFVTPGTIAVVGGLLLIGIGLAIQALQRIEQALAVRPMPRAVRPGEVVAVAVGDSPETPPRIPFPPKPKAGPDLQPVPAAANVAIAPAEDATLENLGDKFPAGVRLETPLIAGSDVSLLPQAPVQADEIGEVNGAAAVSRSANGGVPPRAMPRFDARPRPSASPARAQGPAFNAFWPPVRRDAQTASARVAAVLPPPLPVAPPPPLAATPVSPIAAVPPPLPPRIAPAPVAETGADTGPVPDEIASDPPITILKSGVVEGMAYTLYSDGSIEAQLPQGTLRFGSIAALRNHIETAS